MSITRFELFVWRLYKEEGTTNKVQAHNTSSSRTVEIYIYLFLSRITFVYDSLDVKCLADNLSAVVGLYKKKNHSLEQFNRRINYLCLYGRLHESFRIQYTKRRVKLINKTKT